MTCERLHYIELGLASSFVPDPLQAVCYLPVVRRRQLYTSLACNHER